MEDEMLRYSRRSLLAALYTSLAVFALLLIERTTVASPINRRESPPQTKAEFFILAHLKDGGADLSQFSPQLRTIRGSWLRQVLINSAEGLKLGSSGVRI